MIIRPYEPKDADDLKRIHAERGYSFEYLPLDSPEFVSVWVAEQDGRVVAAVAARKVVEVSAFMAQDWSNPAWRLSVMQELQQCGSKDLARQDFTEMQSWVQPETRGFARRLIRSLGWIKSQGHTCLVRGIHAEEN